MAKMPVAAEEHLQRIRWEADALISHKYRQGQIEHGGELWRKPGLLNKAIEEAIDQVIYLLTLKEQEEHPEQVDATLKDSG